MKNKTDKIINALSGQPEFITILKNNPSRIEKILAWFGFKKLIRRTFKVTPLTLFNKFRISSLCLKMDLPDMIDLEASGNDYKIVFDDQNSDKLSIFLNQINKNLKYFAVILAVALKNDQHKPDEGLTKFILENATSEDIMKILPLIISGLDLGFFLTSLILINRENLLNQAEKPEKIKH